MLEQQKQQHTLPEGDVKSVVNDANNVDHLLAGAFIWFTVLATTSFLFANVFNFNIDDLPILYPTSSINLFDLHAINRRFVTAAVGSLLDTLHIGYYDLIGLWALLFAVSIYYLAFQIGRYLHLEWFGTAWLAAAAVTHGFMAELYSFTMGYLNYAGAMFGAALVLNGLRNLSNSRHTAYPIGVLGVLLCLGSYQSFILLPVMIFLLGEIDKALDADGFIFPKSDFIYFATCMVTGISAAFLFSFVFSSHTSTGRQISIVALLENTPQLINTFFSIYFPSNNSYGVVFPLHERVVYFSALCLMIVYFLAKIRLNLSLKSISVTISYFCLFFVFLCGFFNILSAPYWPTARSMSYLSFVHPAVVAYVASHLFTLEKPLLLRASAIKLSTVRMVAVMFISLSVANHASLFYSRYLQKVADVSLAHAVIEELRYKVRLDNVDLSDAAIAVSASELNAAQRPSIFFDYGASGFTADWSAVPLLRAVSGVKFLEFNPADEQCPTIQGDFEIKRVAAGWLICLR